MEVAINPEELEGLDDAAVQALYRQRLEAQQHSQQREVRCPLSGCHLPCLMHLMSRRAWFKDPAAQPGR